MSEPHLRPGQQGVPLDFDPAAAGRLEKQRLDRLEFLEAQCQFLTRENAELRTKLRDRDDRIFTLEQTRGWTVPGEKRR